jgi:hypothetical protein
MTHVISLRGRSFDSSQGIGTPRECFCLYVPRRRLRCEPKDSPPSAFGESSRTRSGTLPTAGWRRWWWPLGWPSRWRWWWPSWWPSRWRRRWRKCVFPFDTRFRFLVFIAFTHTCSPLSEPGHSKCALNAAKALKGDQQCDSSNTPSFGGALRLSAGHWPCQRIVMGGACRRQTGPAALECASCRTIGSVHLTTDEMQP